MVRQVEGFYVDLKGLDGHNMEGRIEALEMDRQVWCHQQLAALGRAGGGSDFEIADAGPTGNRAFRCALQMNSA